MSQVEVSGKNIPGEVGYIVLTDRVCVIIIFFFFARPIIIIIIII
jgi:hypothetical protein